MTPSARSALGRLRHQRGEGCYLLWFEHSGLRPRSDWFDSTWLRRNGLLAGEATGRGTTHFLGIADRRLVLRHYRRGGVFRRILQDRYPWTGLRRSRAWRELATQGRLYTLGLPVAMPVGARVCRVAWWQPLYRADLLTEHVADTCTLVEALAGGALADSQWSAVGGVIAQFHAVCFEHADLNAHNILLDSAGRVWLIDFDRGRFRHRPGAWCKRNLARLRRSLDKVAAADPAITFRDSDWGMLLAGYAAPWSVAEASSSRSSSASR